MKRVLFTLITCAVALAAAGQEKQTRREDGRFQLPPSPDVTFLLPSQVTSDSGGRDGRFVVAPNYAQTPSGVRLYRYKTEADFPRPNDYYNGRPITVPEDGTGVVPRSDYAFATYLSNTRGGGYFTGPDGNQVAKEREQWITRHSYIDPVTNNELMVDDPYLYGDGDYYLEWIRQTQGYRSCFTFYAAYCDMYGFDFNELPGLWVQVYPSCDLKLSTQYFSRVFYRYSRYRTSEDVPAGAQEWEPAEVPQTLNPLRLNKPGEVVSEIQFELGPREDALSVSFTNSIINPAVSSTGGATIPSLPAGRTEVVVKTSECNGAIPNIPFTLESAPNAGSGGHVHLNSGNTTPPAGAFTNAPATVSGQTDSNGERRFTVTAGTFGGATTYTASTNNIGLTSTPIPVTSRPASLYTGVILRDYVPHPLVLQTYVKLTGHRDSVCGGETVTDPVTGAQSTIYHCDNHRDQSHYGRPELHAFIELAASLYNEDTTIPAANKGRLGINDMSTPLGGKFDIRGNWGGSHASHRLGVDVDVDRSVFDAAGNYSGTLRVAKLTEIIRRELKGKKVPEVPVHYRLNDALIDEIINDIRCDTCSFSTVKETEQ